MRSGNDACKRWRDKHESTAKRQRNSGEEQSDRRLAIPLGHTPSIVTENHPPQWSRWQPNADEIFTRLQLDSSRLGNRETLPAHYPLQMTNTKYQPHIDGLRAIAVLVVLLFHLGVSGFPGGFVGVDVFFVISGFLITRLIRSEIDETGTFAFGRFYLRRARRLAPALLLTLTLSLIVGVFLFSPESLKRLGAETLTSLTSTANIYFWQQADYFDVSTRLRAMLHMWSLSVEEQFYLLWPATIVLLYRGRFRRAFPILLGALVLTSLWLNFPFGRGIPAGSSILPLAFENGKPTIFFLLPFRVFELGIGAMLAWLPSRWSLPKTAHDASLLLGLSLIGVSVASFDSELLFPSFYALVPCIGAALVIHSGEHSRCAALLRTKALVGIGLISYSLYLLHWPMIVFYEYATGPMNAWEKVLLGSSSVVLAVLSYRFIEQPFRRHSIRLRWLVPVALILLVCSASVHWTNGRLGTQSAGLSLADAGDAAEFHRTQRGGADYSSWHNAKGAIATALPPDILLVGDSHAMHYAEGIFKEWAEPEHRALHIVAGGSCFHLPGFVRTTVGYDWDLFAQQLLKILDDAIHQSEHVPVVVMAHAWRGQTTQSDLLQEDGAHRGVTVTLDDVLGGIRRFKQKFGVKHLIILGDVPGTHGVNLFEEMTRPELSRSASLESLMAPSALDPTCKKLNDALRAEALRSGDFVFLDPCDALCTEGLCDGVDENGQPLYSDKRHLSKLGSRRVIRALLPQIRAVLEARDRDP